MELQPFSINIPQLTLDDLRERLIRTRWPDEVDDANWDYGTNRAYLQELVHYWHDVFNWREQEAMLNQFHQFKTTIYGFGIHFIHERGKGPNPIPILLTHGWPDSFLRMYKLIPLLTDPEKYGGRAEDSFDVVVPSIPGYGFSDRPREKGFTSGRVADLFTRLMTDSLGYSRFGAHGGDWGSSITEQLAFTHPASLIGIHLTDIPYHHLFTVKPEELTPEEQAYLKAGQAWQMQEGAYALIQSTKPQTLAYGLNDSPAGLLAWIIEKFQRWSDSDGVLERRFTKEELLTNATIYWVTETINSSIRLYYEAQHQPPYSTTERTEVPFGIALFPKDLIPPPRTFADRFFNVQRWTTMPKGGHFAALEEPELLAKDIQSFFRPLRASS
ncbi:epoxide hydrolase family protein [Spirosoma endbachense]|uniref:Alpha/beta fold hydrolase n=1 Tax=Spirosoma endbachense TaxID=2666025 RepID=A0A6P1VK79_9BACT|nr:epoxide hydrolase family protein [Spirosoma endbachense]QHV93681.1 alpha/beta fold hydrolase [Spirosoma endbachense]